MSFPLASLSAGGASKFIAATAGVILAAVASWWNASGDVFQYAMYGLGALYWLDFILGCYLAKSRAARMRHTKQMIDKQVFYFALIIFAAIVDGLVTKGTGFKYLMPTGAAVGLFYFECICNLHHFERFEARTGYKIPAWLSVMVERVRGMTPKSLTEAEEEESEEEKDEKPAEK